MPNEFWSIYKGSIWSQAKEAYKREGLYYVFRTGFLIACNYIRLWYYRIFKSSATFEFQGDTYHYLFHPYPPSWKNERAVVIPIVWNIVKRNRDQNKRILEVGNVLSHVFQVNHDILDKYEIMDGVINEDVVDFNPSKQYDLIVSIVTLQSVGWYETPRDPTKVLRAIENLKRLLAPAGQMIIIHPLGENPEMDKLLRNGILQFSKQYYLKRISNYKWQEVKWKDVKDVKYDMSIPTANGVVMGIIEKN